MTTLTIYMKSGNRIRLPLVKDWKITVQGNRITGFEITRHFLVQWLPCPKLIVSSIDLSSIEAITRT